MDVLESKEFFSACEAPTDDFQSFIGLGLYSKKKQSKHYEKYLNKYLSDFSDTSSCDTINTNLEKANSLLKQRNDERGKAKSKQLKRDLQDEIEILRDIVSELGNAKSKCAPRISDSSSAKANEIPATTNVAVNPTAINTPIASPVVNEQVDTVLESVTISSKDNTSKKTLIYVGAALLVGFIFIKFIKK